MIEVPLTAEVVSRRATVVPSKVPTVPKTLESQIGKVPTGSSPVASGDPKVPSVKKLEVLDLKGDSATLAWTPAGDEVSDYRVEARGVGLAADGSLLIEWIPVPELTINKTPERITTRLEGMPAGASLTLRVVSVLPDGTFAEPSNMVFFSVQPPTVFFTLQRVMLAFFGIILAVALWLKSGRSIFGWKFWG
jgi:hypothetical protein